jgi:hypothetical protein
MKNLLFLITISCLISSAAVAQTKPVTGPFEGTINFMQVNGTDTSMYKYSIKGNNVRVDNFDIRTKNNEGIYLIDLGAKKMTALSPVRKIYFDQPAGAPAKPAGTPKVTKTANIKKINGYNCTEYDVTDADESTKIVYWLSAGHFDFFNNMLQILNRKDKFSEYYLAIPNTQGMFPMVATQYDMSGAVKGAMKASDVVKGAQSDDTFKIPAGYKEFKK